MKTILFLIAGMSLCGQTALMVTSSQPFVRPGTSVGLTLAISCSPVAAIQWATSMPPGWSASAPVSTAAQKGVDCGPVACALWGMNATPLTGNIATINVLIPANTQVGQYQIALNGLVGADPAGGKVTLTAVPVTINVLSKYDLDGDGKITRSDVQAVAGAVTAALSAPDFDGDMLVLVTDLMLEVAQWIAAGSQ